MPVPCICGSWVELHSLRNSPLTNELICSECYSTHDIVSDCKDEIDDIQYMLDNNDENVKGDRRGWKDNIKSLKQKISKLGFDFETL